MRPFETIPGIRVGEDKGEWWRGCFQVWYITKAFVNATMYPHPAQLKKQIKMSLTADTMMC
jgi:hypothetical protein